MDASLETLVVAAYVFACWLSIPRPGPSGLITDHELIALAVAQAITGVCSDRQFLGQVGRLLPGWRSRRPGTDVILEVRAAASRPEDLDGIAQLFAAN